MVLESDTSESVKGSKWRSFRVVIRKSSHNSDILFYTGCTSCCGVFIVASQFARFIKAELLKHDKCLGDLY